jgi:hypothetical protein
MGDTLRRLRDRKESLIRLRQLDDRRESLLVIHYSCESFFDRPDGATPRITSIAVRNFASGQTESFSIHKVAELKHISIVDIPGHYDSLEKEMLDEFSQYLQTNNHCTWVHWNMRDINYGFQAIEHRYRVLGGSAMERLPEERKFDLARSLVSIYGATYASHPRLQNIVKLNNITDRSFLVGAEEAEAFNRGEFVRLHQSTLRKVDIMANLFGRTLDKTLKTQSSWWEARGLNPQALSELTTEHWAWTLFTIIGVVAGVVGVYLAMR